jgi:hypothetical protein
MAKTQRWYFNINHLWLLLLNWLTFLVILARGIDFLRLLELWEFRSEARQALLSLPFTEYVDFALVHFQASAVLLLSFILVGFTWFRNLSLLGRILLLIVMIFIHYFYMAIFLMGYVGSRF